MISNKKLAINLWYLGALVIIILLMYAIYLSVFWLLVYIGIAFGWLLFFVFIDKKTRECKKCQK